jgi:hypothetical protein
MPEKLNKDRSKLPKPLVVTVYYPPTQYPAI